MGGFRMGGVDNVTSPHSRGPVLVQWNGYNLPPGVVENPPCLNYLT